jgi:hypothetical protein
MLTAVASLGQLHGTRPHPKLPHPSARCRSWPLEPFCAALPHCQPLLWQRAHALNIVPPCVPMCEPPGCHICLPSLAYIRSVPLVHTPRSQPHHHLLYFPHGRLTIASSPHRPSSLIGRSRSSPWSRRSSLAPHLPTHPPEWPLANAAPPPRSHLGELGH